MVGIAARRFMWSVTGCLVMGLSCGCLTSQHVDSASHPASEVGAVMAVHAHPAPQSPPRVAAQDAVATLPEDFLRGTMATTLGLGFDAMLRHPWRSPSQFLFALEMGALGGEYLDLGIKTLSGLKATSAGEVVGDVLAYHLGRMYLARARRGDEEDLARARMAFMTVLGTRTSPYFHRARAGNIEACLLQSDASGCVSLVDDFIKQYPDYPGKPDLMLRFGKLLYQLGDTARATTMLDDLAFSQPWAKAASEASAWMAERGIAPGARNYEEILGRVDFLRRRRFWIQAEAAVSEAMALYPESPALMMQLARIAYEQSHHRESIEPFEKLLTMLGGQTRENIRPASVVAYIYRAYMYLGDCEKALEWQTRNIEKLGRKDRLAARQSLAQSCGAFDVAYEAARGQRSGNERATEQFAFVAYLAKDWETARSAYTEALANQSGSTARRMRYFLARATQNAAQARTAVAVPEPAAEAPQAAKGARKPPAKKSPARPALPQPTLAAAEAMYRSLIRDDSSDYYAILAHSRLQEMAGIDTQAISPIIERGIFGGKVASGEDWHARQVDQTYAFPKRTDFDAWFRERVAQYKHLWPALERVLFFHEAGLYAERNAAFRIITVEAIGLLRFGKRPTPGNLWTTRLSIDGHMVDNRRNQTGTWGIALGPQHFSLPDKADTAARQAISVRQNAIMDAGPELRRFIVDTLVHFEDYYLARRYTATPKTLPGTPSDNATWSILYPHAYAQAIGHEAARYGMAPSLLWTLMNIESAFNPDSISHADAYGLLQVIPMTGYKIAEAMQMPSFGPYELIEPEKSIPMGAWYFAQVLKKFGGYVTLAMAGYNGGPHQVARWLTAYAKTTDHDAFVELIPFDEARNYVKKGMARWLIYHRIDTGNPEAFFVIPNSLPDTFGEQPNY